MAVSPDWGVAAAYSAAAGAWQRGPGPIYDRLAREVAHRCPVAITGARVLDVGAGTGAATREVLARGAAAVVAMDAALGMLAHEAACRPPAVAADVRRLPLVTGSFDVTIAAFSLNHLVDPAAGLREMARVTRPGGGLVASSYAADDTHPVRVAVETALSARGWEPEPWYATVRATAVPRMASVDGCRAVAVEAGLDGDVARVAVPFPDLDTAALVAWRLGMAQHAPFVRSLPPAEQAVLAEEAAALAGDLPVLVRSIIVLSALRP